MASAEYETFLASIDGDLVSADDCLQVARDGVDVTLDVWPGMVHGFQGLAAARIPEAVAALRRVADFVRARIP